jgi:5'-3' exonuclease
VRLLRQPVRKRGAPYVAAAPDFEFYTAQHLREEHGVEPEQARARTSQQTSKSASRLVSQHRSRLLCARCAHRQFVDYQALLGDTTDNIPGVAGIGETTATALLRRYGSLDALLAAASASAAAVEPKRAAKALAAPGAHDSARVSAQLALLQRDVDVPLLTRRMDDAWRLAPPPDSGAAAAAALAALEITSMARRVQALWAPF